MRRLGMMQVVVIRPTVVRVIAWSSMSALSGFEIRVL
jgi:hypothetical protein